MCTRGLGAHFGINASGPVVASNGLGLICKFLGHLLSMCCHACVFLLGSPHVGFSCLSCIRGYRVSHDGPLQGPSSLRTDFSGHSLAMAVSVPSLSAFGMPRTT